MMTSDISATDSESNRLSRTVCALCRQRKTKCDRVKPRCSFCAKAKVTCQYLPQPQKRGLRAGYVTELESRIELLERKIDTLESPQPLASTLGAHQVQYETPSRTPSGAVATPIVAATSHARTPTSTSTQNYLSETNAAVADMTSLPHSYFSALAELWFKEDHSWLPILEYSHIESSLAALPHPVDHIPDVVLRAVIALKIAYSSQAISLGYHGRRRLSLHLRSQVLFEAMSTPSLSSIRAMFIIAMLDYGSDNIPSTFNIMSMCRRTGEHIGIFNQLLQRVESQSPQQVGPPSRDHFMDNAQVAQTWAVLSFDAVSSLGVSWRDVTAALVEHLSGIAYVSAPDFRDSFVTHVHLCAIGLQPVHEFFFEYAKGSHQMLEGETLAITDAMYQNLMSYVHGLPSSSYTILADGAVDFDINHVFTRILSHAAIIMIYQRYVLEDGANMQLARDRCTESYHQTIDIVRSMSDADAEINSPTMAHFIAVAVRFRLVLEYATKEPREPLFDVLMHGVNMCGRRWPLARRSDIIFRIAITEIDGGATSCLPEEFWDLRKSGHDTSETMKTWLNEYKPSLWIGSLNGPYA